MSDQSKTQTERFNRWQGLAVAQLTVAVALISGLSVSALSLGLALLQNEKFKPCGEFKFLFVYSFPLLLMAAIFSTAAVISRLLDFRLTARKVRKERKPNYERPLTMFWLGPEVYGRITWAFFWFASLLFVVGILFQFLSIWSFYKNQF